MHDATGKQKRKQINKILKKKKKKKKKYQILFLISAGLQNFLEICFAALNKSLFH